MGSKKINTIIFDLDGTLLNTLDDLYESTNFALGYFNFPQKTIEQVKNFVGNGVEKLIERAIPDGHSNPDFDKCLEIFKENYSKNMYNKTAPYSGVIEMLERLKFQNYNTAVVSNKFDYAVKELCKKYFGSLIDFCAGENEACGIKKKPAPDTVIKVLEYFSVDCDNALYVGDSEVDILTAKNSGMDCISVCWGFKSRDFLIKNGAKTIIEYPQELNDYLMNN